MPAVILGKKIGMTRLFRTREVDGTHVVESLPVTVVQADSCVVSQIKSVETDGYDAIQLATEDVKPRNSTMPVIGHDAKAGACPKRFHREFRLDAEDVANYQIGQKVGVESFDGVGYVDVIGITKGHGFTGGMKRWGFKGQLASHGVERKHRSPGSVGGHASNLGTGKPKKGQHKSGQDGNTRVTIRSIEVISYDKDKNLLLVKGAVPGPNGCLLQIREAKRLYRNKARKVAQAS